MQDKVMTIRLQTLFMLCLQVTQNELVPMQCFYEYSGHVNLLCYSIHETGWSPEKSGLIHNSRIELDGSEDCLHELSVAINKTVILAKKQGLKL